MTIYELIENMSNHSRGIEIWDESESNNLYAGEVEDLRSTDVYDDIQDAEVVDLYATGNGTIILCIEEE